MVILNSRCTTWLSGFTEAKNHGKELYAYVHNIHEYPTRDNCIDKIRLDTCENYEQFLEELEKFKKLHASNPDTEVRVETYRSEFEEHEWAKNNVIYKIAKTTKRPEKIIWKEKNKGEKPLEATD